MRQILYVISFFISLSLYSQDDKVFVIADTTLAEQWTSLSNDWRYQKGDNLEWAKPEFDDSEWTEFSNYNLNMPDNENAIAERGEIAWFRKRIMADSSVNDALVLNIYQFGASEIYLDGKRIHQLGRVSSNRDDVVNYNPFMEILQLPLEKGKTQVLAVRYVNNQYQFPVYSDWNGYIRIVATTLRNANSKDIVKNRRIVFNKQFEGNYRISLGLAIILFIIFLSFYLFFPNEKINGYFAASIFFLILFVIGVLWEYSITGNNFWLLFCYDVCILISGLIICYCFYSILEQPIDTMFKILSLLCLVAIGCFLLYDPNIIAPAGALLIYLAIIRIGVKSWNHNKTASFLFIASSCLGLLFWLLIITNDIGLTGLSLNEYIPFAFMLLSIVLAIYLGYAFGKRSQDLRLNLERVQSLSKEKQAILASQNETLEAQVKERTAKLNKSLEDLKATQSQLIQSEKMASLGELTAGIAHEIQNPLNFVNNFAEVNQELADELIEELNKGDIEESKALAKDIKSNEEKINHHGKRADSIVKGMLKHSRSNTGERVPVNINALCDEYLRLAYHGLRAKDKTFNATLETSFDDKVDTISAVPQEIGRVVLNIINNALFAVREKQQQIEDDAFKPTVWVATKALKDKVLISIKDNGKGIPEQVRDKIFQPFFTTKASGEGTGLGLSMSYDIIKAHQGELNLNTKQGEYTQFEITLPQNTKTDD